MPRRKKSVRLTGDSQDFIIQTWQAIEDEMDQCSVQGAKTVKRRSFALPMAAFITVSGYGVRSGLNCREDLGSRTVA